jgi:predicted Zn-dependent protease
LAEVQQVLDVEPRQLTANLLSAELLLYQRQPEAAYQQLQPLVATYGDRRDLLSQLARAAQLTGRVEEAQKHQAALRRLLLAAPRESPQ